MSTEQNEILHSSSPHIDPSPEYISIIDTIIQEFEYLADKKGLVVYNIAFRNAGVGIVFFHSEKAGRMPNITSLKDWREWGITVSEWYKKGLVVYKYYPTLSKAIEEETKRLRSMPDKENPPVGESDLV